MTKDKSSSLVVHQNDSLARVERRITLTNKLLSTIDETVTDIDGNVYKTVKIGDQVWMAENLKVTHFRNGDPIPTGYSDDDWANLSEGAFCFYNDEQKNIDIYGNIYNWYAVSDKRGISPEGWHVPSYEEWKKLFDFFEDSVCSQLAGNANLWENVRFQNAGADLRSNPKFGLSKFNILPGGERDWHYHFTGIGFRSIFWAHYGHRTWGFTISQNNSGFDGHPVFLNGKLSGKSIRCLKD